VFQLRAGTVFVDLTTAYDTVWPHLQAAVTATWQTYGPHDGGEQGSATYGPDPARQAKSSDPQPLNQIVVTVYGQPSGIMFYESALLSHSATNLLYEAFWASVTNWKSGVNLIKIL